MNYPRQRHSCAGLFQGEAEAQLFIRLLINSNTIERYQSNVDIQRVNFNDYGGTGSFGNTVLKHFLTSDVGRFVFSPAMRRSRMICVTSFRLDILTISLR